MQNICVVGTGYVGLTTGVCFADLGNKVTCIEIDLHKLDTLTVAQLSGTSLAMIEKHYGQPEPG
ncbi:MAG: hypothetical protein MUD01_28545 [Chloroflexaceae bacterium]|nr:hypothetical protein [Chloroflexaceae bacterium]